MPRTAGVSCEQICNSTSYKNCDGEMAIHGRVGKATGYAQILGSYYNYRCATTKIYMAAEEIKSKNERVITSGSYYSYCCCRH